MRVVKMIFTLLIYALAALVGYIYLLPDDALHRALKLERDRSHLVRVERDLGGLHWVYLEGGQGEPLLLIHGFGADKDNFTRVARWLTPRYHVIAPDLPGFGEAPKPEDVGYTVAEQMERVRAFAQALELKDLHLGGSSMGGFISATWAAKYPAEVRSLWLLAPAGVSSAPDSDLVTLLKQGGRNPLMATTTDEFFKIFRFTMSDPPFVPRPLLDVIARGRIANHALEEKIFDDLRKRSAPLEQLVKGLPTPARIVWGDKDRALNVGGAEILHKLMPNSSVLIMPGIGHLPMLERPEAAAKDYLAFRAELK